MIVWLCFAFGLVDSENQKAIKGYISSFVNVSKHNIDSDSMND